MSTDTGTETREPARNTRHPVPLRRGAGRGDRAALAGPVGAGRDVPRAQPGEPGSERAKVYLLDMFPYPSGAGLHVGHPLGFIGTDVLGRYLRMTGHNVLHAMGFDAFGLPAEQYAVQTGTHPRTTTEANVARYKAQLRRLGLAHDERRSVATTDVDFYRWTQWIFLKIYGSFYDEQQRRARPIEELEAEFASGARSTPDGRPWAELSEVERRAVIDSFRLAYVSEAPVNWCPGLGTVLANEEVTADGRSERGNFPVFRRNLKQWMMRITAYADRLAADLDRLDWPDSVKAMQRNWIGRSEGARVRFDVVGAPVRDRGLHHPPGHPVRRHLHGAGARAPAGRADRPRRLAAGHRPALDRRYRRPPCRRPVAAYRAAAARASPSWTARRTRTRPASSPAHWPSTR